MARPRDDRDAARDLADIAGQLGFLERGAHAWLRGPDCNTLKLKLEIAYAAVSFFVVWL